MRQTLVFLLACTLPLFACTVSPTPPPATLVPTNLPTNTGFLPATATFTAAAPTATQTVSATSTVPLTETPPPSETPGTLPSNIPLPVVDSLKARVTVDRLSCRYGPGPDYLYLFAFRGGANIELIGRVDAENWHWALVKNQVPCWVSANFIEIQGDMLTLPVVYPGIAKLPITPYYPPSQVLSAQRNSRTNEVTVSWVEVPISPGDYESDAMQTYIIEVWRCQAGELIFEPLATRSTFISFVDEPGCNEASHGRVWVQEKHGYAGPAEIPWPE
jgi:hypothetical protein